MLPNSLVGNLEMVEACVRLCSQLAWEWGPIKCHQYELDKFFRAATLICSQGRGELVQLAQFKRLFQDRWESYAQVTFYAYFILHLVTCCILTFLMPWFPVVASTRAQDEGLWAVHTVLYLFLGLCCPFGLVGRPLLRLALCMGSPRLLLLLRPPPRLHRGLRVSPPPPPVPSPLRVPGGAVVPPRRAGAAPPRRAH